MIINGIILRGCDAQRNVFTICSLSFPSSCVWEKCFLGTVWIHDATWKLWLHSLTIMPNWLHRPVLFLEGCFTHLIFLHATSCIDCWYWTLLYTVELSIISRETASYCFTAHFGNNFDILGDSETLLKFPFSNCIVSTWLPDLNPYRLLSNGVTRLQHPLWNRQQWGFSREHCAPVYECMNAASITLKTKWVEQFIHKHSQQSVAGHSFVYQKQTQNATRSIFNTSR